MMEKSPLFILAGNGPYDNRGCEAIVRGTVKIIRHYYKDPTFLCISHFQSNEQFEKQCIEEYDQAIIHKTTTRVLKIFTLRRIVDEILKRLFPIAHRNIVYQGMLPYIKDAEAVLSIGGDNYSLDYSIPKMFTNLDDIVFDKKKALFIWGASVGPFSKNPEYEIYMIKHLEGVTGVFARESATLEYLEKKGLKNNLYKVADPAFLMDPTEPKKQNQELKIDDGSIGLNLSPLMAKHVTNGNLNEWVKIAANIVSSISERTSRTIYLIPHVTTPHSNDYLFLKGVYAAANVRNGKVVLIPPIYNASEIKWIIGKMFIFAGARTHSTIAALSLCVPTLSFAYSMKAIGINKDIYGHDSYCISPNNLNPEIVIEKIECLLKNHDEIQTNLREIIPRIQNYSLLSGKYLQDILNNQNKD